MHRGMTNLEIAKLLRAIAAAYKLKGEEANRFRIIAYERAADAIEHESSEVKDIWDEGRLADIPGIGKNIASHLDEIFRTGTSKHFEKVLSGLPVATFELMDVPGIGPKGAYTLAKKLGITKGRNAIAKLEEASRKGEVAKIEGFGEDSQTEILKGIEELKGRTNRMLLPYAMYLSEGIISWMRGSKFVKEINPLGSLRRQSATVGDIDISVASDNPEAVIQHFTSYPKKTRVIEKGSHTASILIPGDIQVDLMVQEPNTYGSLLQHFTGSKHHNIALREYAMKKGMSLSEYGIRVGGRLNKFADEESFYRKLGMDLVPPELREDTGEIEAAIDHKLPKLVELSDVKGDLQVHSDFNIETSHDLGESTMRELVEKANSLGYEYIAFTEHNPSQSGHNDKEKIELLKRKKNLVEELNYSLVKSVKKSIKKVFNCLEIDILPDGSLPVPEEGFDFLDLALVSIHSSFRMSREEATKRVISALSHPKVKIFAHPTGRKINQREGVELNWPQIFDFCAKEGKWIEINADPMRLDLPDFLVHEAIKSSCKMTLGTDAHHADSLDNMRYGVSVARRGWAEASDIINTLSFEEFVKIIP